MIKYRFELIQNTISDYKELAHIVHAGSLLDAIEKFGRKHRLETPAWWDEPVSDRYIELAFRRGDGKAVYRISW